MSARVLSVGTASPAYSVSQEETKAFAANFFAGSLPALHRLLSAFDNTRIARRQLVRPVSWYAEPHSFVEKNAVYCEAVIELSAQAGQGCERSNDGVGVFSVAHPSEVDGSF